MGLLGDFADNLKKAHERNNAEPTKNGAKPLDSNNRSFLKTAIGGAGAKELANRMNLKITGVDNENGIVTVNHPNGGTFAIDMNDSYQNNYDNLIRGIGDINKSNSDKSSSGEDGDFVAPGQVWRPF